MIEMGSIKFAFTILGWKNLLVASPRRNTVIIQILDSETTEPITSALCHPKDNVLSDFL